jgi:hypothetical protein
VDISDDESIEDDIDDVDEEGGEAPLAE